MKALFLLFFQITAKELTDFIKDIEAYENHQNSYLSPLKASKVLSDFPDVEINEEELETEQQNANADEWKCSLADGWQTRIEKWYNFLESGYSEYNSELFQAGLFDKQKCINALDNFDRDLRSSDDFIDGKLNPAKIMCSSWGYKGGNVFQNGNFLAKYGGKQLFPNFPGMPTQCYFAKKHDRDGQLMYSGAYGWEIEYGGVELLRNIFAYGVKDYRECAAECDAKGKLYNFTETDAEYVNCKSANCGAWGTTGRLGLCYPAQCSPVELVLAREEVTDDQIYAMKMTFLGNNQQEHLDLADFSGAWVQRAADVAWLQVPTGVRRFVKFVEPLYRVSKPTIIASAVVLGLYFLFVLGINFFPKMKNPFLAAFHVATNYEGLINTERPKKAILCLDGIRSLSIWWVVIGHIISQGIAVLENQEEIFLRLKKGDWMKSLVNGMPSVDSFFCMGGILVAYLGTDKIISSSKRPVGFLVTFTLNLLSRWMRIVPLMARIPFNINCIGNLVCDEHISTYGSSRNFSGMSSNMILFYDSNILYFKVKHTVSVYGSSCVNNNLWLRSLFFVQGFYEEGAACMPHIWYVGAEFWYNVLFPFQAVLYGFHKALGVAFTVLLSCGSIGWAWYQSVDQDAMPFQQQKLPYDWPSDLDKDIYLTPWSRYHAYGVGILFGWLILAERKGNGFKNFVQKRKVLGYSIIIALWALSLFTLYFTIYGFSDICFQVDMTKYQQSIIDVYYQPSQKWDLLSGCFSNPGAVYFWNATHRAIWAFALGLLIFLCDCGFGSFIHSFLSFKGWNILAKLSFGVYIFHYNVIVLYQSSVMEYYYVDEYWMMWMFLHIVTLTTAISAFIYVTYEIPLAKIWGLVLKMAQPRKKEVVEQNDEKKE